MMPLTNNLTYQEAEAILQELAGPTSAERSEFMPLVLALAEAKRDSAPRPAGTAIKKAGAPNQQNNWTGETFHALIEAAPDAWVVFDTHGIIQLVNARLESLFGYRRNELLGYEIDVLLPQLFSHVPPTTEWDAQRTIELSAVRRDGREFPVEISMNPLAIAEGTLFSSTIRDISSRKRLEARYRNLVEGIPAVTFLAALDEGSNELYVSPQIEQLLGFSQKEWLEDPVLWYTRLHPDDRDRWHIDFAQTCVTAAPFRSVYRFIARDGRIVWVQGEAKVVRDSVGRPLFLQGVAFDITERKNAEEALRRAHDELEDLVDQRTAELAKANSQLQGALVEKESLLKEIHHRVKNNLQIISSLLSLQSTSIKDPSTLHAIRESQNRVRSMALVHEKLYQSQDLARISFARYVRELAAYLMRSYGASAANIKINVDIENTALMIDTAIPCGLIITELVSNSLKHAFTEDRGGQVTVSLHSDDQGVLCLRIHDNGKGLPKGLDPRRSPSLGLQLVATLANQLRATLEIESDAGTSFTLRFREVAPR